MTKQAKKFQENYQKLEALNTKLSQVNSNDISTIVENLPEYIKEFEEADNSVKEMMTELDKMQELLTEKVTKQE